MWKFADGLGVAAVRAGWCPPGAFPSQGRVQRVPVCLLVWGGLIVCVVAIAPGGACGWLPARAAAQCGSCWHGSVVALAVRSPSDLWMISPVERRCSVQRGLRSGCGLLLVLLCRTRYNEN